MKKLNDAKLAISCMGYDEENQNKLFDLLNKVYADINGDQEKIEDMENIISDIKLYMEDADSAFVKIDACGWLMHNNYSIRKIQRANKDSSRKQDGFFYRQYVTFFKSWQEAKDLGCLDEEDAEFTDYPGYDRAFSKYWHSQYRIGAHMNQSDFLARHDEMKWMDRDIVCNDTTYRFFVPETYKEIMKVAEDLTNWIASSWKQYIAKKFHYVFITKGDDSKVFAVIIFDEKGYLLEAIEDKCKTIVGEDMAAANMFLSQTQSRLKEMCV